VKWFKFSSWCRLWNGTPHLFIVQWTQNNCELRWTLKLDKWEGGEDRKTIAQREREHSLKQVQAVEVSQRRTAVSSKCFQLYYTCSDRLLTIALPPCPFHRFPLLLWRFPKLAVILRPLYKVHRMNP
jgi:hypothetical protein